MESLNIYINSIKGFERISRAKEKELSHIVRTSQDKDAVSRAKEKLINGNYALVIGRALKMKERRYYLSLTLMDLIAEGNIALMNAANSYDGGHESNASFGTYATRAIDVKLREAIQKDHFIHLPYHYSMAKWKLKRLKDTEKGDFSDEDIFGKIKISKDTLETIKNDNIAKIISLEDLNDSFDDHITTWEDKIEDGNSVCPSDNLATKSINDYLLRFIDKINPKEGDVLKMRHFDGNKTFDEIRKILNVSRSRVVNLYSSGIRKLKIYLTNDWRSHNKHVDLSKPMPKRYINSDEYYRVLNEKENIKHQEELKAFQDLLKETEIDHT